MLQEMALRREWLPEIIKSSSSFEYGAIAENIGIAKELVGVPITGVLGD